MRPDSAPEKSMVTSGRGCVEFRGSDAINATIIEQADHSAQAVGQDLRDERGVGGINRLV